MCISTDNPAIIPVREEVLAEAGSRVELSVYASASRAPLSNCSVRWHWPNGTEIQPGPGVEFRDRNRRLFLEEVSVWQSGSYAVTVTVCEGGYEECVCNDTCHETSISTAQADIQLQIFGKICSFFLFF